MSSPRKMASGSASTRGVSLPPVKTTQNSPRGGEKLDASQLTPRRRQKLEVHSSRDHLQSLLPNKISTSSKNLAEMAAAASRPKAAPRSPFEQEEDEQPKKKNSDSLSVLSGGRYGNKGGGDGLLRLPLEGLSKMDIRDELKHGKKPMIYGYGFDNEDGEDEEEEEEHQNEDVMEQDRARFNVWKGTNYELHLLGDFKSDFEKRVKSFQRPKTEPITMDPFCRNESGLLDEPPKSDAFLVWKSKSHLKWTGVNKKEPPMSSPFPPSYFGESAGEEVDIYEYDDDDHDGDSLPDPEMSEYILAQQLKREEGESLTGETLYYDEDFDMVRNLHRDSYSLTNYGVMPDDKWIGKAHLFYPEMTEAEKKMLRAPEKKKSSSLSPRYAVGRRLNK